MKTIRGAQAVVSFDRDGNGIVLEPESVWSALERAGFSRSETVKPRVEELLPLGNSLIRPRAIGRLYDAGSFSAADLQNLPAPTREAEYLCFGLCTVGGAFDEETRKLREQGELVDSMILDAVALAALSQVCDRLGRRVFDWAALNGMAATRAFSPGSGASHWELEHQRLIFAHVPADRIGVRLTSHLLMQPSKSVSFLMGIGRGVTQATDPFSCAGCERLDCPYRHVPNAEMVE